MKKGFSFFGLSTTVTYLILTSILFLFLVLIGFENAEDQKVIDASFKTGSASTIFTSYLRQVLPENLRDVNDDGNDDAYTVADLLVLGYKDSLAKEKWIEYTKKMIEEVQEEDIDYDISVKYPGQETFVIKRGRPRPREQEEFEYLYLPLPENNGKIQVIKIGVRGSEPLSDMEIVDRYWTAPHGGI